jgi:hypothetical protein
MNCGLVEMSLCANNMLGRTGQKGICFGGGKVVLEMTEKCAGMSYLFS